MRRERRLGQGLAGLLSGSDDADVDVVAPPVAPPNARLATPDVVEPEDENLPLIDDANAFASTSTESTSRSSTTGEVLLSINLIEENPFQPRREFDEAEIASLSESLKDHDLLQPILVRRLGQKYQLISGERRLRAARLAGWKKLPARIREADDRLVSELAIIENLQRKDLNAIEKALSFQRYLDEHDCRQEDLAQRLKISRPQIANLLRLLELPAEVRRELQDGSITAGHARALLPLGDRKQQIRFCRKIKIDDLSVRAIEQLVSETVGSDSSKAKNGRSGAGKPQNRTSGRQIASLEKELRRALGTKVDIKAGSGGAGRISIHFKNHGEFERIRDLLSG